MINLDERAVLLDAHRTGVACERVLEGLESPILRNMSGFRKVGIQ